MIELQNIAHSYGDNELFKDLSLSFPSHKLTCLLGGSGSGKTTILRLIAGLEIPLSGNVLLGDKTVSKDHQIILQPHQRNIGFVFQDLALWPHFTVYQNIAFGLEQKKESNVKERVETLLRFFEIEEQADRYPHQLSGGQQQLVAIARSLILAPKVLLMDEPLANLDVKLKRKILTYINKLKQNYDLSIIYVTHDHREAFAIADHIIVLQNGIIEDSGSVAEIMHSNNEYVKYFLEY